MSKARDLANLISTGNALSDGAISVSEISDLTASAAELNKLDGVTATTAELNHLVGATSSVQTQLDNISVTSGSLTKTFTQNETADITLSQNITSAPVVSATKEVPQTGISTKGNWDVNSTASNYDFHNTATNVTLTPTTTTNFAATSNAADSFAQSSSVYSSTVGGAYPQGFAFAGNGMYYYIARDKIIYRFELTTAYDLTTAANSGVSFSTVSTFNQDIADIYVTNDGTQLFTVHSSISKYVARYTMSTAHDLANLSYQNNVNLHSYSGGTLANPNSVTFKPDGTIMYITDFNSAIFSYSINSSYPFNVGYVTAQTGAEGFGSEIASSTGVRGSAFTSDGTKMYILDDSNAENIVEYTLSTAWDITTKSYTNNSFNYEPLLSTNLDNVPSLTLINDNAFVFLDNNSARVRKVAMGTTNSLVLGSGSFASTDVGKRIVGNGGDVVLTSTSGAYSTTGGSAFTDSSTIAAGSWSMFGLKSAGDVSGITMASLSTGINNANLWTKDSTTYDASANVGGLYDIAFKPDGTKMFATSYSTARTHEFSLSSAWDISTASHVRIFSYSTGSYGSSLASIAFKSDGTKMYLTNYGFDYIMQVSLPTAWSLDNASLQYVKDTTYGDWGNINDPTGLLFNSDGTKVYLASNANGKIAEVNLGTAWDIHSGGNTFSTSINVSSNVPNIAPTAMQFSSDGTKLFIGNQNAVIHQYNLTTAYDLSTASYSSITKQADSPMFGFALKPDDTKFFTTQYNNSIIYQYSSASITQPTQQYHVAVTNSGGQIDSSNFVDINSMTAAENAGTGTAHYAVSTDGRTTWSVAKGTDGVRPIVQNNSGTWQYNNDGGNTTINSNISSATYSNSSFSYGNQTGSALGVTFKPDGTRMYVTSQHYTYQYNLSTPFDLSTATYSNYNVGLHSYDSTVESFFIKPDGTKAWFVGRTNDQVRLINLSTAWELNTATVSSDTFSVSGAEGNPTGLWFKPDGTKMYFVGTSNDAVWEYSLSTAWDVTTASYTTNISVAAQDGAPSGLAFNSTGTKMYVTGELNVSVFEYNLSTAWDVSTATYSNYSLAVNSNGSNLQSVFIGNNDEKIYVILQSNNSVYEYSNASNAYTTTATWVNGTVNDELYTLQQALGAQSHNRMDKTQLDAVADANHFTLGNSLDLMIALRMDTAAATLPTSDGVTLNYDAAALNEGAVLGTDYDFFFPANNKVQIKSLAAQNLKVRVV